MNAGSVVEDELRSPQMCRAAGITFRQLDYLTRSGIIAPASHAGGSGSQRTWVISQIKHLRLAAVLREYGATEETLRPALARAVELPTEAWNARVLVTLDGRICPLLGGDANGWAIDLAHCRDRADDLEALLAA